VAQLGTPPGAWKQNMLVLLLLYPVVFLFFTFVPGSSFDWPRRFAVRGRAVHRQRSERSALDLSGAVDVQVVLLVACIGRSKYQMAASSGGDSRDRALWPYVARVWLAAMTSCCGPQQRGRGTALAPNRFKDLVVA
jgi:hypothetical protein